MIENYFEEINTIDKAYYLGLLFSDGYNFTHENKGNYFSLRLNIEDINILEKFKTILNTNIDIKKYRNNKVASIQINGKKICNDLTNLGCMKNKSKILLFPNIKNEFIHHFIRGYFDGDGSIWEGKRKKMKLKNGKERIIHNVKFNISGTIDIIENIQNILIKELNFKKVKINFSKKIDNFCILEYSGRLQIEKFYNYLYKDSNLFFLDRKKNKFESIIFSKYRIQNIQDNNQQNLIDYQI